MRSLHNVLEVMGSSFGEVVLVQIYTADVSFEEQEQVRRRTLAYMRRTAPSVSPLIALSSVPRLPKNGCVEIAVVCSQAGASPSPQPAQRSLGADTAFVAVAEASVEDRLLQAAERCLRALCRGSQRLAAVQVQYAISQLDIEEAVKAALVLVLGAEGADLCALSFMPVETLGPVQGNEARLQLRLIALGSEKEG